MAAADHIEYDQTTGRPWIRRPGLDRQRPGTGPDKTLLTKFILSPANLLKPIVVSMLSPCACDPVGWFRSVNTWRRISEPADRARACVTEIHDCGP